MSINQIVKSFKPQAATNMVTNETTITSFILVMPSWFAGSDNETVTITVTTGDISVSAGVDIEFVPSMIGKEININ